AVATGTVALETAPIVIDGITVTGAAMVGRLDDVGSYDREKKGSGTSRTRSRSRPLGRCPVQGRDRRAAPRHDPGGRGLRRHRNPRAVHVHRTVGQWGRDLRRLLIWTK